MLWLKVTYMGKSVFLLLVCFSVLVSFIQVKFVLRMLAKWSFLRLKEQKLHMWRFFCDSQRKNFRCEVFYGTLSVKKKSLYWTAPLYREGFYISAKQLTFLRTFVTINHIYTIHGCNQLGLQFLFTVKFSNICRISECSKMEYRIRKF